MKKLSIVLAAILGAALMTSALAVAKPQSAPGPKEAAAQECEALAVADGEAFDATYGQRGTKACVQSERAEAAGAVAAAVAGCRDERGRSHRSRDAFRKEHRSGKGANDAFGNCVSAGVRSERRDEAAEFKNAAKECRAERGDTPESRAAFEAKYGTNRDDPLWMYKPGGNAFGKCVSSKVGNRDDD
jgi:hypothetical protein